jgi:hypothetical protein
MECVALRVTHFFVVQKVMKRDSFYEKLESSYKICCPQQFEIVTLHVRLASPGGAAGFTKRTLALKRSFTTGITTAHL